MQARDIVAIRLSYMLGVWSDKDENAPAEKPSSSSECLSCSSQ